MRNGPLVDSIIGVYIVIHKWTVDVFCDGIKQENEILQPNMKRALLLQYLPL